MGERVYQCIGLVGGEADNLDAQNPSAFTGKEIAFTIVDPTLDTRKLYTHQAVNSGATADGIFVIAPTVSSTWRWHIIPGNEVGSYVFVGDATPPPGTLEADGSAISRTAYAALYAKWGVMYGAGDGSTTFNIIDLRGKFLRVWDHGAGVDPDAATRTDRGDGSTGDYVGTKQAHAFKSHAHATQTYYHAQTTTNVAAGTDYGADVSASGTNATGGSETRPVNTNIMCCVRY